MTTRLDIETALRNKNSEELNVFFNGVGLSGVNPGGANNEEQRRVAIIKYRLDAADTRPAEIVKICRGLGLPSPEEAALATTKRAAVAAEQSVAAALRAADAAERAVTSSDSSERHARSSRIASWVSATVAIGSLVLTLVLGAC